MGKLQNAAYQIFIEDRGINYSPEFSSYDNVVHYVDYLGEVLLTRAPSDYSSPDEHAEMVKKSIGYVISALIELAGQQNLNMEDMLVEVLEKYKISYTANKQKGR